MSSAPTPHISKMTQHPSGRSGFTCEINAQKSDTQKSTAKDNFEIGGAGVLLVATCLNGMGVYFANNGVR